MAEGVEEYRLWTMDQLKTFLFSFFERAVGPTDWEQGRACQKSS